MKIAIITNRLTEDSLDIWSMYFHLSIRHNVDLISNVMLPSIQISPYTNVLNIDYDIIISTESLSQSAVDSIRANNSKVKIITTDVAGYFTHDMVFNTPFTLGAKKYTIPNVWSDNLFKDEFYQDLNSITFVIDHIDKTELEALSTLDISNAYNILYHTKSLKIKGFGFLETQSEKIRKSSHLVYIGKHRQGMISILMEYIYNGKVAIHNVSEWKDFGYYIEDIKTLPNKIEEIIINHKPSSTYSNISSKAYKYNNSNELLDDLDLFLSNVVSDNPIVRFIDQETNKYI